jgi:FAD-dependent urate hydroxylase
MTPARRAIVIGGGIAGPATAMALQKAGIEPVVYEAHATAADGIGAFLTVASNGIDALRVLGADRAVLGVGFPTPAITLRSHTGRRLGMTRTGRAADDGTVSHTMRRADLYRALHEEAEARGIAIRRRKRLVDAVDTGDGVRAMFADGSEAQADVLVGADGVRSTVRRIIDPTAPPPRYGGLIDTGGYATGVPVRPDLGSYEMIFGRRAFFGYAAAPGGEVWWFANVPRGAEPTRAELASETRPERLLDLFADDAGPATDLIAATPVLLAAGPTHTMPRLPAWHRGRMVVVGDAAHAPSPTSGQGASLSIEDALVLATCLRDGPDVRAALAAFQAARRPRVERIIKWAARINSSKAAGPVGRVLRDAMMPAVLRLTADTKALRETFDFHVDWDAPAPVAA